VVKEHDSKEKSGAWPSGLASEGKKSLQAVKINEMTRIKENSLP
jgi:hypothetical protein